MCQNLYLLIQMAKKNHRSRKWIILMEVARDNDLGIEGTCGGSISCCTCHVIIDKEWFPVVGGPIQMKKIC